ncbi:hypothetical protein ACFL4T_11955 [candidate division KSB1 bacterium]
MSRKINFSIITIGFTANIVQIVFLRELVSSYYGNELAIGIMLSIWLIFTAAGSGLVSRILPKNRLFFYRFFRSC